MQIAEHVQGDAIGEVLLSAHAIDRLLHFAVAPIPPFHGVRGGRQEFVIEKCQRLVQVGRAQLGQDRGDFLERGFLPKPPNRIIPASLT